MNKLVIFITEGKSEENALYSLMRSYFRPNRVIFHIYHGDILIKRHRKGNPLSEIESIVQQECSRYGLSRSDILRVIHIADTDGLFIPDTAVRLDYRAKHAEYEEDAIYTCNPDSIKQRNRRRRGNVKALIHTRSLQGNIPYSIFYLSRNIEHALYGIESHVNDSRKTDLAYDFSDHFGYDWKLFMNYIENEDVTIGNTYKESWELIQNDTESLKRHTNIIYLFDEDV